MLFGDIKQNSRQAATNNDTTNANGQPSAIRTLCHTIDSSTYVSFNTHGHKSHY